MTLRNSERSAPPLPEYSVRGSADGLNAESRVVTSCAEFNNGLPAPTGLAAARIGALYFTFLGCRFESRILAHQTLKARHNFMVRLLVL